MVRVFLITANVGSVFEDLDKGLNTWMNEFISVIRLKDPEFVAIHFQETGGKNYENGSDCVDIFFGNLVERMGQLNFRRGEGFVDSQSDLEHQFTALSNVYFVHERLHQSAVSIWDFQAKCFQELESGKAIIYSGPELDHVHTKEKEKFPQNFYPNCKWSRKGFIRTRWRISGKIMDFVNIHLFHDSDNVIAASTFPSEFSESRQKTMNYTLSRLQNNPGEIFPLFIFGDFNFRLNTHGVMGQLRKELANFSNSANNANCAITLGTKEFDLPDLERRFLHSYHWLKQYDFEVQNLQGSLTEMDLSFHPTYPFEEDETEPEKFMRTRCPAWCDRVLYTEQTRDIISQESPAEYNVLGSKICMGDHKPVYLTFNLANSSPNSTSSSPSSHPTPGLLCHHNSGYRMTLTPTEVDATNVSCRRKGHKCRTHPHSHPSRRRFANLFGLRERAIILNFPSCKKSSVSSDSVSINPPSSSQTSYENETSASSPQHSRANTIKKCKKEKNVGFPRNLFTSCRGTKISRRNAAQKVVQDGKLPGNDRNIEIIEPLFINNKLGCENGDNNGHKNRIILPLIMSSHSQKEKAGLDIHPDIIRELAEISAKSKSNGKCGVSSFFAKYNSEKLARNGKNSGENKK